MKQLRFAALITALLTLPSLLQSLLPFKDAIGWLLMSSNTAFGLFISSIIWFLYFSEYRFSRQLLFWQAIFSLPLTALTVLEYFIHRQIPFVHLFVPAHAAFMLNLAITFSAYYLIQILYRWLPRTTLYINGSLAVILFITVLSVSGHVYKIDQLVSTQFLMPIPWVAVLSFLLLASAIFIDVNRKEGFYLNPKIVLAFVSMFLAVLGANVVVYINFSDTVALSTKINGTQQTLRNVYDVDVLLDKVTSSAQSYVQSQRPSDLAAYNQDRADYRRLMESVLVNAHGIGDTEVYGSAKAVSDVGTRILAYTDGMIAYPATAAATIPHSTTDVVLSGYLDDLLDQIRDLSSIYSRQIDELVVQEAYGGRGIITGVSISSALTVLLIIFTPLFIRQTIRKLFLIQERLQKSYHDLNLEKSRIDAIITSMGDGMFTVAPSGVITLFNPAAERISGFRAADVVGKKFDSKLHFSADNGDEKLLGFVNEALRGNRVEVTHNVSLDVSPHRKINVQISAAPIQNRAGAVTAAIVLFLDRTQEQELENAKDDFVSLASHQLRTPATATKQFLGMFLQGYAGDVTDKQRLFLQEAYDNNELGIKLIEELLNITRLESNRLKIQKQVLDANDFIRQAAELHADLIHKNKQQLVVHIPDKPMRVFADPNMLTMALDNLITNASKYTLEGGTVTLDVHHHGSHVCISVSDTGIGMRQADIPKIFGRFTRLEDPGKQHVSGTGIGLYLVQKIMNIHHGKVSVQSEHGKGSTFTLVFNSKQE